MWATVRRLGPARLGVGDRAVGDLELGRQVERSVRRDLAVLERAGDGEGLERRARLVGEAGRDVRELLPASRYRGSAGFDRRASWPSPAPRRCCGSMTIAVAPLGLVGLGDLPGPPRSRAWSRGVDRQPMSLPGWAGVELWRSSSLPRRVADDLALAVGALRAVVVGGLQAGQALVVGADASRSPGRRARPAGRPGGCRAGCRSRAGRASGSSPPWAGRPCGDVGEARAAGRRSLQDVGSRSCGGAGRAWRGPRPGRFTW